MKAKAYIDFLSTNDKTSPTYSPGLNDVVATENKSIHKTNTSFNQLCYIVADRLGFSLRLLYTHHHSSLNESITPFKTCNELLNSSGVPP